MELKMQIACIWGIIVNPKRTLSELPSEKFYIMSLIISISIILSRLFPLKNPDNLPVSEIIPGVAPLVFWFTAFFFLISFIVKVVAKLFGKEITYKRAMNIVGYCQMPRVIFMVPISIVAFAIPAMSEPNVFNKVLNLIALIVSTYSFALIVYGVKLSQGPDKLE